MERIPSLIANGPFGPGSRNLASPKSPPQGVWAVQRAGPIRLEEMLSMRRFGAVSSSKCSIMTGRSSQDLGVCAEAAYAIGTLRATRARADKPGDDLFI